MNLKVWSVSRFSSSKQLQPLHTAKYAEQSGPLINCGDAAAETVEIRASNKRWSFPIAEKDPTRPSSAFTVKTLLRHYAKQVLTHGK